MLITDGLVEQHIHGAFGCDFMTCSKDELLNTAEQLAYSYGVTAFFPTIMTDNLKVIKERIKLIKYAKSEQKKHTAQIIGIHLEGPFINPQKAGIHEIKYILPLDINLYKQIDDEIIKIITLAPELDTKGNFINYLQNKNVKISAGHCIADDLSKVNQITHLYNAMAGFTHRGKSTVISSLTDENIYTEIIADSIHISDEVLKITFKQKSLKKILLISDALPLAHSSKKEQNFSGQTIYNKDGKLVNNEGIFAGSSMLLCDIIKNLADKKILTLKDAVSAASFNQLNYHKINNNLKIHWNNSNEIEKIEFI